MSLLESTKKIAKFIKNSDQSKPELALELWNTRNNHKWKNSQYGSWRSYCDYNVAMSSTAIYQYLYTAKLIKKFTYSLSEVNTIVAAIGWSRFQLGISKITVYLTVEEFVLAYKNINLNQRVTFEKDKSELVSFTFSMSKNDADILTDELIVRGMRLHKQNRINASAAMIKLIKEISEKSEY
jgi:hypothetical protein